MTQSIIIQVGQCGNQIGSKFWDMALKEHSHVKKTSKFDTSMSTFFSGIDNPDANGAVCGRKARAVLIDMEEGVVNEVMKSNIRHLFSHKQLITDVSGSGNNWATGFCEYGTKYIDQISETVRNAAEMCDCLQCFFVLHSMGGGTGSGLGTRVTKMLADEYPDVYRFVTAVYPSHEDDDVVTSPYNSVLAMRQLTDHADCVMPIENQSLLRIVRDSQSQSSSGDETPRRGDKPFDSMNSIVANLLLNLTSSSRFEGTMNVDLNEISMNLVPFPRLHYLVTSQAPLYFNDRSRAIQPRKLDQIFSDSFTKSFQMMDVEPKAHTYLACALLVRGCVEISDVRRNIERHRSRLKFVPWNQEGWKVGLCSVAPIGQNYALLNLANNCSVYTIFDRLMEKFKKLYKRKAHMHHYSHVDGFDVAEFGESFNSLQSLRTEYWELDRHSHGTGGRRNDSEGDMDCELPRLRIAD